MLTEATSSQLVESLAKVNQFARANKLLSAMEEAYYALKFAPTYLPLHVCIGDLLIQESLDLSRAVQAAHEVTFCRSKPLAKLGDRIHKIYLLPELRPIVLHNPLPLSLER